MIEQFYIDQAAKRAAYIPPPVPFVPKAQPESTTMNFTKASERAPDAYQVRLAAAVPAKILIEPTIGRQVWYRPGDNDSIKKGVDQPLAATIAYVHSARMVNLQVINSDGIAVSRPSVLMVHGDESYNPVGSYCEWMPYQKGQAKAQETKAYADGTTATGPAPLPAASPAMGVRAEITEDDLILKSIAPRVTAAGLDALIKAEHYHVPPHSTLTLCVLTLANGFTVTGESACADPANFNEDIGRRLAFANAKNKIWALEGYLLKQQIHERAVMFNALRAS
jgi:hypothetical protein